jgi:hypothetical protein
MKKLLKYGVYFLTVCLALFIGGCSTDEGGNDPHHNRPVRTVFLGGHTYNNKGTVSTFLFSMAASNENIKYNSPRTLTLAETVTSYHVNTENVSANNYFFGNSILNHGVIHDPLKEKIKRQLYAVRTASSFSPGTYTVEIGSQTKEVIVNQQAFLPVLSASNVSTGPLWPDNHLNVTVGDTITLSGQTNPNLRYFCRIYDTALDSSHTLYTSYWTSKDVRNLNWLSAESVRTFLLNSTESPQSGKVTFTIPPLALNRGTGNLLVIITAYDTSMINIDTGGDFETLVFPQTQLDMIMSGI